MPKSTGSAGSGKAKKPEKPHRDFPLFAHGNGQWCKKLKGCHRFFVVWADPDAALQKYLDEKDNLLAGREHSTRREGLAVADLCNRFLTSKEHLRETGEITNRTFLDYHTTCRGIVEAFGRKRLVADLSSADFDLLRKGLAKTRGPVALVSAIQRVRSVFKYAYDASLIEKPVRCGPKFKRPSRRTLSKARKDKGPRMFEAAKIRTLLDAATPRMKAMLLLGVNAGLSNSDCDTLPIDALNLDSDWLDHPRPTTGVRRRLSEHDGQDLQSFTERWYERPRTGTSLCSNRVSSAGV